MNKNKRFSFWSPYLSFWWNGILKIDKKFKIACEIIVLCKNKYKGMEIYTGFCLDKTQLTLKLLKTCTKKHCPLRFDGMIGDRNFSLVLYCRQTRYIFVRSHIFLVNYFLYDKTVSGKYGHFPEIPKQNLRGISTPSC